MAKKPKPLYVTGAHGVNRVWVFRRGKKSRALYLGWFEQGPDEQRRRRARALGQITISEAKTAAEELAAALRKTQKTTGEEKTLAELFETYLQEKTPFKGQSAQKHDRRALPLFIECWGSSRVVTSLRPRDWDLFIRLRRCGALAPPKTRGGPVRDRTVEQDLALLRAVFHWAQLNELIHQVPMARCSIPREENVLRPMLYEEESQAMIDSAPTVHPRCRLALLLAHDTGRRSKSIRELRWSDIDLNAGLINWPAESDKQGKAYRFYAPESLLTELRSQYRDGETWVFPSDRVQGQPVNRRTFDDWWERCEKAAGIDHVPGRKWHSMRRKWATERKDHPSVDVAAAGGWNGTQTLLKLYTQADEATMRKVANERTPVRKPGSTNA